MTSSQNMSSRSESGGLWRWTIAVVLASACGGAEPPPAVAPPPRPAAARAPAAGSPTPVDLGSFVWHGPRRPPRSCAGAAESTLDVWCEPLPPGALARLGASGMAAPAACNDRYDSDEPYPADDPGCHLHRIDSVALSADGLVAATSSQNGVRLWHAPTGTPLLRLALPASNDSAAMAVAFAPGPGHVLVAAGGCALRRYDVDGRRALPALPFAPLDSTHGASTSAVPDDAEPNGGAAAADAPPDSGCTVPLGIAVAPDGDEVVVTTTDGLLRRFSLARHQELPPVVLTEPNAYGFVSDLTRPVIAADGRWIAVGERSELWVLSLPAAAPQMKVITGWEDLRDLAFAPSGSHLAVLTGERIAIVDPRAGVVVRSAPLERAIHVGGAIRYGPRGRRLLVLATDRLMAFDPATIAPAGVLADGVDDGVYGRFAVGANGLWIHPDGAKRMLARALPRNGR